MEYEIRDEVSSIVITAIIIQFIHPVSVSLMCLIFPYSHVYIDHVSPYLFTGLLNILNFMLARATYVHTTAFSISATFFVMFWLSDLA
jgi:hypothetical protein